MNTLVIDASIAVKWVIEEDGMPEALAPKSQVDRASNCWSPVTRTSSGKKSKGTSY
ncbi:MAG: hypothetical protein ABSD08_13400 [Xanthobacteraceae bacterium]